MVIYTIKVLSMESHGDSCRYYSEQIKDKEIFFKEHKENYINKTILEMYHTLHHHMSKHDKNGVYFGDIIIDGQKIDTRNIKILDLDPEWVYEANEIETKDDILITNPIYVPGKTLKDYQDQIEKRTIENICDAITRYIELITQVRFTEMNCITPNNIKLHIKGNIAELIVTDISCSIRNFFYAEKNAVVLDKLHKKTP